MEFGRRECLSVAPFVVFFLLYAGIIIAEMVERGL